MPHRVLPIYLCRSTIYWILDSVTCCPAQACMQWNKTKETGSATYSWITDDVNYSAATIVEGKRNKLEKFLKMKLVDGIIDHPLQLFAGCAREPWSNQRQQPARVNYYCIRNWSPKGGHYVWFNYKAVLIIREPGHGWSPSVLSCCTSRPTESYRNRAIGRETLEYCGVGVKAGGALYTFKDCYYDGVGLRT